VIQYRYRFVVLGFELTASHLLGRDSSLESCLLVLPHFLLGHMNCIVQMGLILISDPLFIDLMELEFELMASHL
jgi:hypothetical protein